MDWLGPPQAPVVAQVVDVSVHDSGIGAAAGAQRRHKVVQAACDVADLDREELRKSLLRVRLPVLACASGIRGSLSVDWHSELALRSARVKWAEDKDCKTQGGAARTHAIQPLLRFGQSSEAGVPANEPGPHLAQ